MEHPTSSWQAMQDGNVFYRRKQLYSIPGKLPNLSDYIVAGSRYGGPLGMDYYFIVATGKSNHLNIALMRDSSKLIAVGKAPVSSLKPQIQVISCASEGILSFSVDNSIVGKATF